jgi:hypothetical protein
MLSVKPTGRITDWYRVQADAARLVSDETGNHLIKSMQLAGIEDGFFLGAELLVVSGDLHEAQELLAGALPRDLVAVRPRAARRYLELARKWTGSAAELQHQYTLLTSIESSGTRLIPMEQYHFAVLEYQRGRYDAGWRRFSRLRQTQNAADIDASEVHYVVGDDANLTAEAIAFVSPLLAAGVIVLAHSVVHGAVTIGAKHRPARQFARARAATVAFTALALGSVWVVLAGRSISNVEVVALVADYGLHLCGIFVGLAGGAALHGAHDPE